MTDNTPTLPNADWHDAPCGLLIVNSGGMIERVNARLCEWLGYEAQALASCNWAPRSYVAFIASGGLNLQIEHHLLPGVNHHHLFKLAPDIRQICERHGVRYQSFPSFTAALRSHFALMKRLSSETVSETVPVSASEG